MLLLPASVPSAERAHDFLDVSELGPLVLSGVEDDEHARSLLAERLDASDLSHQEALARLAQPPDGRVAEFYRFLVDWAESEGLRRFASMIAGVSCVQTVAGQWRRPDDRLFFPRQREEIEFPEGLAVPIVDLPDVDGLRPLLEEAGVSSFEWRQLLPEFIFPLLTDDSTAPATRRLGLEALRLYFQTERTGDPRLRAQAARVLLPASKAHDSEERLIAAEEIYFRVHGSMTIDSRGSTAPSINLSSSVSIRLPIPIS